MTKNAWNHVSANTIDYNWKHTGKLLIVNVLLSKLLDLNCEIKTEIFSYDEDIVLKVRTELEVEEPS